MEESTITSKGQIVVPARLRRLYGLTPGMKVKFIERNDEIIFQPQSKKYIRSVHGLLTSETSVTKELLEERSNDRKHEERNIEKHGPR